VSKSDRHRRRPPILTILAFVIFVGLLLAFVTFRQLRVAKEHRLRLLAGLSERVEDSVEGLAERFVHTVDTQKDPETVAAYLEEVRGLEPLPAREPTGAVESGLRVEVRVPEIRLSYVPSPPREGEESVAESEESAVGDGEPVAEGEDGKTGAVYEFRARIDLQRVVEPIIIPEVFDSILIARGDGRVLFQQGERDLRQTSIRPALEAAEPAIPGGITAGTALVEDRVADAQHYLFAQPIELKLPSGDGPHGRDAPRWLACGIISRDRLLSASFTASPVLLFLLVAIFPAGLVSWPYLKLWLISRRQRFTRLDVAFLLFSTFLGLALLAFLVFDFLFVSRLQTAVDGQLESVSRALSRSARAEIGARRGDRGRCRVPLGAGSGAGLPGRARRGPGPLPSFPLGLLGGRGGGAAGEAAPARVRRLDQRGPRPGVLPLRRRGRRARAALQ